MSGGNSRTHVLFSLEEGVFRKKIQDADHWGYKSLDTRFFEWYKRRGIQWFKLSFKPVVQVTTWHLFGTESGVFIVCILYTLWIPYSMLTFKSFVSHSSSFFLSFFLLPSSYSYCSYDCLSVAAVCCFNTCLAAAFFPLTVTSLVLLIHRSQDQEEAVFLKESQAMDEKEARTMETIHGSPPIYVRVSSPPLDQLLNDHVFL